jgi:hypothetical protein
MTRFLLLSDNCGFVDMGRPALSDERTGLSFFVFLWYRTCTSELVSYINDRRSVGHSVLVSSPHLGLMTRFLLLSDNCGFVDMGRPFWREDGSVVYKCCCLRQRSHSKVRVPRGSWPHFTVSDLRLPQPGGPGPCIYTPRNRVARLYLQALGCTSELYRQLS